MRALRLGTAQEKRDATVMLFGEDVA